MSNTERSVHFFAKDLKALKENFVRAAVEEMLRRSFNNAPEKLKDHAPEVLMKDSGKVLGSLLEAKMKEQEEA